MAVIQHDYLRVLHLIQNNYRKGCLFFGLFSLWLLILSERDLNCYPLNNGTPP